MRLIDRYGPAAGPLVIVLHGAVVNAAAMAPLARALEPHVRVWVPDLPGHGSRRDETFAFARAVGELTALIDTAAAGTPDAPIVVAGDSLGGYLALACAQRRGVRLAGVVAGGCSFPMHGWWSLGAAITNAPATLFAALGGEDAVGRLLLRGFVALGGDAATAEAIRRRGMRLAARAESIGGLRRFAIGPALREIACPVVLVNGARDMPIALFAARYARLARRGRAIAIAGSAHGVMTFAPRPVAAEILALIDAPGQRAPLGSSSTSR